MNYSQPDESAILVQATPTPPANQHTADRLKESVVVPRHSTRVMPLLIVVGLMLASSLAGYFAYSVINQPAHQPPIASNSVLLQNAVRNMAGLRSYRVDIDYTLQGSRTKLAADVDVVNQRVQIYAEGSGSTEHIIIINNDKYVSTDGGKTFQKGFDTQIIGQLADMWNSANPDQLSAAAVKLDASPPATAIVDDGQSYRYISADKMDIYAALPRFALGSPDERSYSKFWLSEGEMPLVRQWQANERTGDRSLNTFNYYTYRWSHFNEPFDIQPPPSDKILP